MVSIDVRQAALVATSTIVQAGICTRIIADHFPSLLQSLLLLQDFMRVVLNRLLKMMSRMGSKLSLIIFHKSVIFSSRKLKLIVQPVVLRQLGLYIYCQPLPLGLIMVGRHLKTQFSMRNPSLVVQRGLGMNLSVSARRLLSL